MSWIQQKYISLISHRLRNYKRKPSGLYNFSCPFCGDSSIKKRKARGYLFFKKSKYWFHCHNCGLTYGFEKFLKEMDPVLYKEYMVENFFELSKHKEAVTPDPVVSYKVKETVLSPYPKISQLPPNHVAKQYVLSRKIPNFYHSQLRLVPKFKAFVNSLLPDKFESTDRDETRIVIPLLTKHNDLIGFVGRSMKKDADVRYITIMLDELQPRVFGIDQVDFNRRYYVVEGPFDAMTIENAIAACGAELIAELGSLDANKENAVIVYDNQPRNKEVIAGMRKALSRGYKVAFWPEHIEQKDINAMVTDGGYHPAEICHIIDENTYSGLAGELRLTEWKKL